MTSDTVIVFEVPGTLECPPIKMKAEYVSRTARVAGAMAHDCEQLVVWTGYEWVHLLPNKPSEPQAR